MADFTALKTAIQTYIKQNGNEEITGDILQEILLSVVTTLGDSAINDLVTALNDEVAARQNADGTLQQNITNEATARGNADTALGGRIDDEATARANGDMALSNRLGSTITAENTAADQIGAEAEARAAADTALQELIDGITENIENGYVYAGIATPSSTPATGKVFYLALTAGTYTNFGNTEVSQGINILKYNGSAWSLDTFIGIDDELTPGSNNIPKSGNVLENIIKNGSAFDLSAYNAVDGVLATYADLDAALTALNALPAVYKQGGMSFRFVRTSDNKYEQYRLTASEFTTDITAWIDEDSLSVQTEESEESLNFSDENGNVTLNIKNGHLKTKKFDSRTVATNYDILTLEQEMQSLEIAIDGKQDSGNYVEAENGGDVTKLYFKDEEGNVIAEFAGGEIMTKHFNSTNALTSKGSSQNLNLIDSFGNVILSIKNGHIATSKFKSIAVNRLLSGLLERVIRIEKDEELLNRKMIPAVSWIDDDFITNAENIGNLTIYRNWCNANSIHGDIALIPDAIIDAQNHDISSIYFTDERRALIEAFENDGFEFLVHPPHNGLYNSGSGNTQWSDEYIRKNIAMTVRCFLENNLVPDILVYPGASGSVAEVIKCAKRFFNCAIQPGGGANGIPTDRYNLKRINADNISAERTVTQIKQEIANAISNGYWVIIQSHVWMCTGDGTEATDETSMSFANLFDIITYANTLSSLKPVREVWRDRSILWDYYTNIN